jgi:mannose-6-phosphate isomerase
MLPFEPRPYLLANKIQHYAWGSKGKEAFIPQFLGIEAEKDQPFAELWIGAHPRAPSDVILDGGCVSLPQLVSQYPQEILGGRVATRFSGAFPFLFKVLSAAEALSIQAHPNKEQARLLHQEDPLHYPDDNHKPEVAVALDSLTALMGFKSLPEIRQNLAKYPELADLIGRVDDSSHLEQPGVLQTIFSKLMRRAATHKKELVFSIERLAGRLVEARETLTEEEQLFLDLRIKYPEDAGLYAVFLLNLIHLERGQGVFIGPGIPHAYLKGNIVECMATSDNVVRAGLTRKFKDVETLVEILTYDTRPIPVLEEHPGAARVVYQTPVPEFQVSRWALKPGQESVETPPDTPQVLLVVQGNVRIGWGTVGQTFQQGQSILIPACLKTYKLSSTGPAELFTAQVP